MARLDTSFLQSLTPGANKKLEAPLDNFKSTQEIFGKAQNTIDTLPLDRLRSYSKHPFKIRQGERMAELVESILDQGILVPLIVRLHPEERGCYEILAGHHRYAAAEQAGLLDLPCIIKNVDDDMAALIVVESNKQRGFADMLPSEIAAALRLEYDALKCQGKRTDLLTKLEEILHEQNTDMPSDGGGNSTLCPVGTKLDFGLKLGETNDISRRTFHRYIRLNELVPPLLLRVDNQEIAIRPAVELSYLVIEEQEQVESCLSECDYRLDMKKAEKLKEYSRQGKINQDSVQLILSGGIFEKKEKRVTSVKLNVKQLRGYIPAELSFGRYEEYILTALRYYKDNTNGKDNT